MTEDSGRFDLAPSRRAELLIGMLTATGQGPDVASKYAAETFSEMQPADWPSWARLNGWIVGRLSLALVDLVRDPSTEPAYRDFLAELFQESLYG